jgi:hypothetical protein
MLILLSLIIGLIIIGCSPQRTEEINNETIQHESEVDVEKYMTQIYESQQEAINSDYRDENGCIPIAGYIWCEPKQRCISMWEEDCFSEIKLTARIYCNKDNVSKVQICGNYIKLNNMPAESGLTYYKVLDGAIMEEINCPLVPSKSNQEICSNLNSKTNCEKVC